MQGIAKETKIKFENISVQDGLSNNFVNCIFQDSRGFIWIGTKDGLNCYDGYTFKKYHVNASDSTSISNNFVNAICEDPSHSGLWVGTNRGLNFFDFKKERFKCFSHHGIYSNAICDAKVLSIIVGKREEIWVATTKGLYKLIPSMDNRMTHYGTQNDCALVLSDDEINIVFEDHAGDLWIGYVNGQLDRLVTKDKKEQLIHYPDYRGGMITSLCEDQAGELWITTHGSNLLRYDRTSKTFYAIFSYDVQEKNGFCSNVVMKGHNGSLWVGHYKTGLMEIKHPEKVHDFQKSSNSFRQFKNDPEDQTTIIDDWIRCLCMDKSGVLWAGTRRNGIVKVSFLPNYFNYHSLGYTNKIDPNLQEINSIIEDHQGMIWIGTAKGLISYDRKSKNIRSHDRFKGGEPLSPESVFSVCEDINGRLWMGTYGDGLYRYDHQQKKYTHLQKQKGVGLSSDYITSVTPLKSGDILIGTALGGIDMIKADQLEKEKPYISPFLSDLLPFHEKFHQRRKSVFQDKKGIIWITTVLDGLYKYDPNDQSLKHYSHNPKDTTSISDNHVTSICEGDNGLLWIATDKGLDAFDVQKEVFTRYFTDHDLPDNTVIGVMTDGSGFVWALTRKWISRLNPNSGEIRNFNFYHRVVTGLFTHKRICKTHDGEFFVGTQRTGFFSFHPDSINRYPFRAPVVITDMKISGKSVPIGEENGIKILSESINQIKKVILEYDQNNLTFEFSALSFLNHNKNRYACKLEGAQDYWLYLEKNRRSINYFNLDEGTYIFKVKASNFDGRWNDDYTSIIIRILPPWWRTWWAYTIYATVFILLLIAFYRYTSNWVILKNNLKLEKMEKAKIKELNKLKLRFFTNISHEFRTPLTLILGPLENLIAGKKVDAFAQQQYDLMYRNTKRMLRLINLLMDFRKVDNQEMKMNIQQGDVVAFIRGIVNLFEEFAKQKQINLAFDCQESSLYMRFDRDKMDKILFNLLSNAFKYTPVGGTIRVGLQTPDLESSVDDVKEVKIIVEDSGSGISGDNLQRIFDRFYQVDYDGTGTGIGLSIVKSFVEMHGGTVFVSSALEQGTRFVITLPFDREMLDKTLISDPAGVREESLAQTVNTELINTAPVVEPDESIFPSKKPLILVVEDDKDLRGFICDSLSSYFALVEADNGVDGLDVAIEQQPALIISDVMMPQMDGLELCRQIKNDHRVSHIPMILLTALSSVEDEFAGYKSGAQEYISKPFNPQTLLLRVQNLVALRNRMKERFAHDVDFGVKEITISSSDEKLLEKVMHEIEDNLKNPDFTVEKMGQEIGISRVHLNRKIKALTNQTAVDFIRTIRMKQAAKLLIQKKLNVSEIAYMVGFSNPISFSRSFKKYFGVTPSEYAAGKGIL